VTTINFIADKITKYTWKNLIVVRMTDKIQAKIKRCHNNYKNTCRKLSLLPVINFFQIFFRNYIRYKIIHLLNVVQD
jgi:hypothetical protein